MPTILLKKSDTPGSVPGTANLTNLAGGVEVAVNTADKRVYSMTSASAVIELGTNPSSLTCADVSATVLRAGSATITNLLGTTLTISGNSFLATSSGNVGVGTASPATKLDIRGAALGGNFSAISVDNISAGSGSPANTVSINFSNGGTVKDSITGAVYGDGYMAFATNDNTEKMRLTAAGNLGIGTASPTEKLTVAGNIKLGTSGTSYLYGPATNGRSFIANSDATAYMGIYGSAYGSGLDSIISFVAGTTNTMTFNASGNLGLGVTPSTWSLGKAFEIGHAGNAIFDVAATQLSITQNAYYNAAYKYGATAAATRYDQAAGQHIWYNAASGTAGNTITFTQAMTLDASGNLGIGTTSPTFVAGGGIHIENSTASALHLTDISSGSTSTDGAFFAFDNPNLYIQNKENGFMVFETNATERARITSGGDLLVGATTASASSDTGFKVLADIGFAGHFDACVVSAGNNSAYTCWDLYSTGASAYRFYVGTDGTVNATNTTISAISDQRLKENIRDLDVGLNAVMALKPRKFDWKAGKGKDKKDDRGFIAQEFEQVFPDLIDEWKDPAPEGEEPYKSVRQDLIPVLVKAIQELKTELDAAKVKIATLEAK